MPRRTRATDRLDAPGQAEPLGQLLSRESSKLLLFVSAHGHDGVDRLVAEGFRAEMVDGSSGQLGSRIRRAKTEKVPYILVVGDKEKASGAVSVRARGNVDLGAMSVDAFSSKIADDIARKA